MLPSGTVVVRGDGTAQGGTSRAGVGDVASLSEGYVRFKLQVFQTYLHVFRNHVSGAACLISRQTPL